MSIWGVGGEKLCTPAVEGLYRVREEDRTSVVTFIPQQRREQQLCAKPTPELEIQQTQK